MRIELVQDGVRKAPAQLAKAAISPRAPFKSGERPIVCVSDRGGFMGSGFARRSRW